MKPEDIDLIRRVMPEQSAFPYYPDRESPWLLARAIDRTMRVAELKSGRFAALLDRPLVKPLVASSGGVLAQSDVFALAHADRALRLPEPGATARACLETVFAGPWQDYVLTLSSWGTEDDWRHNQLSRKGGNLVLQLGFPSDHAVILGRSFPRLDRSRFEFCCHPVRLDGRPTLAWVRLDIDLSTGAALIEEIQSDWLRWVSDEARDLERNAPRTREARVMRGYEGALVRRYAKAWPSVAVLAALMLLADELGVRSVWMHQPGAGALLKGIPGRQPPRSLYTQLPRRFCFRPTREPPLFLARVRRRALAELRSRKAPMFWRLDL